MTDDQENEDAARRARIVAMREEGFTPDDIARELGLTRDQVLRIMREEGLE